MARRASAAQALGMRARITLLSLICSVSCSSDDRGHVDLSHDPSTALGDGGDTREVPPRDPDSGTGNVRGTDTVGGGQTNRGLDAGVLDAAALPGNVADGGGRDSATPYSCQTANDCAVRNVGGCCGYLPRCANANGIFTPPGCPGGMVSDCGFIEVDSCACELGQCVSLSAGIRISYP
jgi:hypothetical protein